MRLKDLTGQRFGRLLVLKRAEGWIGYPKWDVRCDCGKEYSAWGHSLRNGDATSCGCARTERIVALNRRDLAERFWEKVDKSGGENACWMWKGATYGFGHGMVMVSGKTRGAHRIAYELTVGPIPTGLHILHSCNVAGCVNPRHLRPGTAKDNMADRKLAGRHGLHLHPEAAAFGERNGQAKLKTNDVRRIHLLRNDGLTQKEIADVIGLGQAQVCRILSGLRWKSVWCEFNGGAAR